MLSVCTGEQKSEREREREREREKKKKTVATQLIPPTSSQSMLSSALPPPSSLLSVLQCLTWLEGVCAPEALITLEILTRRATVQQHDEQRLLLSRH